MKTITPDETPEAPAGKPPGPSRGGIPGHPPDAAGDGPPLSIGLASPGWPPDAFSNGIISYVDAVARGLRALGHRVTILNTGPAASGEHDELVCDLHRPGAGRNRRRRIADWLWFRAAPRAMLDRRYGHALATAVARAVAERGIEVLEMEESFGWAGRVQPAIGIPLSVRLHGPWFLNGWALGVAEDAGFRRRVAAEGQAIRRAAAVTAPSRDVLERTRRHYGLGLETAEVIPNPTHPLDPAGRWSAGGCAPGTVLFVGRFDRHKGGDLIIDAFGRVLRAVPDARLHFVGPDRGLPESDGRPRELDRFVEDRLPGARASGRVRLLGQVPHSSLAALRREAMVSVICSRYENFPGTVLEAAAMGCPIVAARVGGIPEAVRDGVDRLLHRPGDPDDLAAKIVDLLSDPARAAELGRRAATRCAQEFHPISVAARMVAHYRRLRSPIPAAARVR
jgi:glycosyltransferase involved in cell wall biosynthesis